jgi:hypothetical protein
MQQSISRGSFALFVAIQCWYRVQDSTLRIIVDESSGIILGVL